MNDADKIIKKYNNYEKKQNFELSVKEDFRCNECKDKEICIYAWDLYNKSLYEACLVEK